MVSIFKAIRDNDLRLLSYYIDASTGDYKQFNKLKIKTTTSVKNFDLNKRSTRGRTALHVAVTWNRVEMAQALIDCPQVNVNIRDRENGWTALHRSLYMGNIEIARLLLARQDIDLNIKDWEGLSAFELFNSTILDTCPNERILHVQETIEKGDGFMGQIEQAKKHIKSGGTDVYTWGHNTNYVLGHADSENRLKPERVKLQLESQRSPFFMKRPQYLIQSVSMSKYHMAILTSDLSNNLLVCGFGRGGRLGLGRDADTQFIPVSVQWSERIVSVALGRDHTIAVTENGNVISFGNNTFGQLGYETDSNSNKDESLTQPLPRKIQAQSLKKQPILGAAASRIHSVVYTSNDIFTFGYNQGQLGYQQPDLNDNCQTIPRKVSMSTEILQVVANDNATVILNTAHEIILLCNYNQQKLFLPVSRFPKNITVHHSEPNYPIKLITSGTEYLGAITNTGDVFVWTCRSTQVKNSEPSTANASNSPNTATNKRLAQHTKTPTIVSNPKRIWTATKSHLVAIDASLGQHGEIMICTRSGHVFIGRPDSNGYRFNQVPYLQRCIQVCANSSGAFAAIRSEYIIPYDQKIEPSTLRHDLSTSLPHVDIQKQLSLKVNDLKSELSSELENERSKYILYGVLDEDPEVTRHRLKQEDVIRSKYNDILQNSVNKAWEQAESISLQDQTLDIVFIVDGKHIYCHSSILQCRSKLFTQLSNMADRSITNSKMKFKLDKRSSDNRIEININECELASILLLLDYIYTDDYEHPMKAYFKLPILCIQSMADSVSSAQVKQIQNDLVTLAELCKLPELMTTAQSSFSQKPFPLLRNHLDDLLSHEKGANILISTKEKQDLKCHEVILRQRCEFFKNLFEPNSVWLSSRRDKQNIPIYLDHSPKEIMETIIRYIYLDLDDTILFDDIEKDSEESMLQYLLLFLCEADFLLLKRLKSITEKVLVQFIKLRSATAIFEYADIYLADFLKKASLQFITVNLPVFLGSSMLDSLPQILIRDLENYVRDVQMRNMPLVQRTNFDFNDDLLSLTEEDTEFSDSIYASMRGDGSVTTFDEVLVTYYPQKQRDPQAQESPTFTVSPIFNQEAEPFKKLPTPLPANKIEANNVSGKFKKGVRVSLDNLENELKSLSNQQRRRSSAGWSTTQTDTLNEPVPKPSLREILETENQPMEMSNKSQKTAVPKKISQKERRRLVQKQELAAVIESSSSSPKPVWGKVPTVNVSPISKTMVETSHSIKDTSSTSDRKGKKVYVREEEIQEIQEREVEQIKKKTLYNPTDSLGPTFSLTPIRRLRFNNSSGSLSDPAKKSFQTIQKQQELEDNWLKSNKPKKNILKIQKEEQALESISQFYIQTLEIMSGEWCEIKRITTR